MKKKIVFRPEISLELHLSSKRKQSVIKIHNTDDAFTILDSIKELTTDHLAIIYLDKDDVVIEIDTFLQGVNEFSTEQATRALSSVIYNQNSGKPFRVILAQTVNGSAKSLSDYINVNNLAKFSARLLLVGVELIDCILIGDNDYFSFKRDKNKWIEYSTQLGLMKELVSGPFLPEIIDDNKT
jgi:DNA repair protein RadC